MPTTTSSQDEPHSVCKYIYINTIEMAIYPNWATSGMTVGVWKKKPTDRTNAHVDCISNEWADSLAKNYYKLIYGFWRNGNELKYMPTKLRNTVLVSKIMYYLHLTIEFKIIIWKFNFWKKYDFYVAFVNHGSWMNDCRLTSYRWAMNLHFLNRIFSIIVDIFIRLKRAIAASGNTPKEH